MFLTQIHDRTSAAPGPGFPMDLCQLPAHRSPEEHQPFCPQRSPPVQLELLPMHPSSRSASRSGSATPVSCSTSLSWPGSASAPERPPSGQPVLHRDFDMNRMPSGDYDDVITSSPHSVMSPFNVETSARRESSSSFKRERETSQDLDLERMKNQEVSSRLSDEEDGGGTRKKLRLSKEQSALLEESFKDHSTLNPKQKNALAKQLNLSPRQVEVWFQNRRARTKLKQTEVDCELLKRCCESLTEENRRLQKELQELRAIKVAPPCVITQDYFMPLPAATLTMCPSCEKIATIDNSRTTANYAKQQYYVPQLRQSSAAC